MISTSCLALLIMMVAATPASAEPTGLVTQGPADASTPATATSSGSSTPPALASGSGSSGPAGAQRDSVPYELPGRADKVAGGTLSIIPGSLGRSEATAP
jgi:hypothetical protein